jgi:signal peptidase I
MGWILFILGTLGFHAGLYGLFKKANVDAWKALIPFYNTWVMVDLMKKKKTWFWLQLIPIVGQFVTLALVVDFSKHYGKFQFWEHALVVFLPFVYLPWLGFSKEVRYIGSEGVALYKKSSLREWVDAAVFAIVAATIIRLFVFEAYTIPTPSMERSLLVNDFLFVSKLSYGPRFPNTPLSFPFVHHTLPITGGKSYLEWIQLPYKRIFAQPVKRNDVVVFNLPVGDTVINDEINYGSRVTYYEAIRQAGGDRDAVWNEHGPIIITRPVDKRENFIKRCVAIAGDTLEVRKGIVYINGRMNDIPAGAESNYILETNGQPLDPDQMRENYGIREEAGELRQFGNTQYEIFLTADQAKEFSKLPFVKNLQPVVFTYPEYNQQVGGADIFPNDTSCCKWTIDQYGPLYIPAKGATIDLNEANYKKYERVIRTYEGNAFQELNGKYLLNNKEVTTYTFKQNYYWLMGDNRHNSLDSRYWGFVPEDHVVGKAWMIFFSWENGPRWKRLFRLIH